MRKGKLKQLEPLLGHFTAIVEQYRLRMYEMAEEAAAMPLEELIAYLEALHSTDGKGIPKAEWKTLRRNIDAFRQLAEPLRELAAVYTRLERGLRPRRKRKP